MTEEELLREYPLLSEKSMELPKASIIGLIGSDGDDDYTDDRGMIADRISDWSDTDDDQFFYEMERCMQFIKEFDENGNPVTAYTTPEKLICLNYPNTSIAAMDENRFKTWYFIYCHECLHQLWDTFGVANEIKAKEGSYNHTMLNIASDCVINHYLRDIAPSHKKSPMNIIFPETLKQHYGVDYNSRTDTQYTLYMKLLNLSKEQQKNLADKYDQPDFGDKKIRPKSVQQGDGGESGSMPSQQHSKDYIDGWTKAIKDYLDGKVDPKTYLDSKKK